MARLRLQLFGPFQVFLDNAAVTSFRSDKSRALLAYLAAEATRVQRRESLANLFWGDFTDRAARRSLSTALTNLRTMLAPVSVNGNETPVLATTWHEVVFTPVRGLTLVDVVEFDRLLAEAARHDHRAITHCQPCLERLARAAGLYSGSLLAGLTLPDTPVFDDWHRHKAQTYELRALDALSTLTHHHIAAGNLGPAEHFARRQIAIDSLREAAHRQLMTVLAASGQRSAALAQFDSCRRILAAELGVDPEEETVALYQELLAGSLNRQVALARPDPVNPYKGLNAFAAADAPDYYGRETLTLHLADVLDRQPLVCVLGASGSGKSSLVQAGLLVRLASQQSQTVASFNEADAPAWSVCRLRPGPAPLRSLAAALAKALPLDGNGDPRTAWTEEGLAGRLRSGESLSDLIRLVPADRFRVLLFCDQLEELFTLCEDAGERAAFLGLLTANANSAEPTPWLKVLLTLRADFLGQLLVNRPAADALRGGTVVLGPMDRRELEAAIVLPARAQGAEFQDGLAARLLADVGEESGRLPLLQFCLTQLWQRQQALQLTHRDYDAIGGVAGALTRYADEIYGGLTEAEKLAARRALMQMVRPGVDTEDTRRPVTREQLAPADWAMVQRLADARLVVTDRDERGRETAEIVHEALIQGWELLRGWIDADRAFYLWQQRGRVAAAQWRETGRDEGALLRGAALAEAAGWLDSQGEDIGPDVNEFVAASQARQDQEAAELAARQARELEQVQAMAQMERQRFQSEARANRRLRWLAAGFGVVMVLALASGLAAWSLQRVASEQTELARQARTTAEQQAERALARQLAAQAVNLSDTQLDLAALLSDEALRRSSPDDRRDLLLNLVVSPLAETHLHGHTAALYAIAVNSDGQTVASGAEDGSIKLWDLATASEVAGWTGAGNAAIRSLAFSPDDRVIAAGNAKGGIQLWDAATGEALGEWSGHTGPVNQLLFSADGRTLRSVGDDDASRLWDVASGQEVEDAFALATPNGMAISQAGDAVAAKQETTITVQSLADSQASPIALTGHTGLIHDMEFSPDGRLLASASFDGQVILWDLQTGQPVHPSLKGHEGRVLALAFSPDGSLLATGGTDGELKLWHVASGRQLAAPDIGHENWVRVLRFTPDGQRLISGDASGSIMVWNVDRFSQLEGHTDTVRPLAFSPDGRSLASGSYDTTVRRWDVSSGLPIGEPLRGHRNSVIALGYSPDGRLLVSGSAAGDVVFWDAQTGQQLTSRNKAHESVVLGFGFSPDGQSMASVGFDGVVNLWDLDSLSLKGEPLTGHQGWTMAVAYSPDGSLLASTGVDAAVRFWDAESGAALDVLPTGHTGWVTSLAFSPDGKTLATGSLDETVRLWDVASRQLLGSPVTGHPAGVWTVAFDPSDGGDTLVSVDGNGAAIWWDVETRQPLTPPLHSGLETEGAALSPDGSLLAIGNHSQDGTISLWQTPNREWEARACQIANRNLTPEEWQQYLGDLPYGATCPGKQ